MQNTESAVGLHPIDLIDRLEANLISRYGLKEAPYIPASKGQLSNYILDGYLSSRLLTAFGYFKRSAKQLNSYRRTQRENGMVPGVSFPPQKLTVNPERLLGTQPFVGNDYTQSPVWADPVLRLYDAALNKQPVDTSEAIDPDIFLADIYTPLLNYYLYIIRERQVSPDDPRTFLIHPNEANRDSAPEYDKWKQNELERQLGQFAAAFIRRKPRRGERMPAWFNYRNRIVDYAGAIAINLAGYKADWEPARIHETTEFIDIWFNCLLQENYEAMSELAKRLGRSEEASMFSDLAAKLEQAMLQHYDPEARDGKGAHYSIYNDRMQYKDTIGNLAMLLLRNLPPEQLHSDFVLMDEGFSSPFVLPSIATYDVANFDPNYEEKELLWHNGLVWGIANLKIKDALDRQMDRDLDGDLHNASRKWWHRIDRSDLDMIATTGDYAEHYSPITGKGKRNRTMGHILGAAGHMPI